MLTILAATTGAGLSTPFSVNPLQSVVVNAPFLVGAETATIQITNGNGTFRDVAETTAILTATNKERTISAAGDYAINKTATVTACPILVGLTSL